MRASRRGQLNSCLEQGLDILFYLFKIVVLTYGKTRVCRGVCEGSTVRKEPLAVPVRATANWRSLAAFGPIPSLAHGKTGQI